MPVHQACAAPVTVNFESGFFSDFKTSFPFTIADGFMFSGAYPEFRNASSTLSSGSNSLAFPGTTGFSYSTVTVSQDAAGPDDTFEFLGMQLVENTADAGGLDFFELTATIKGGLQTSLTVQKSDAISSVVLNPDAILHTFEFKLPAELTAIEFTPSGDFVTVDNLRFDITAIPEANSFAVLAGSGIALLVRRRRTTGN